MQDFGQLGELLLTVGDLLLQFREFAITHPGGGFEVATALGVIKEFLNHYQLDFSLSVLQSESQEANTQADRSDIAAAVGLPPDAPTDRPLLLQLLDK